MIIGFVYLPLSKLLSKTSKDPKADVIEFDMMIILPELWRLCVSKIVQPVSSDGYMFFMDWEHLFLFRFHAKKSEGRTIDSFFSSSQ